MTSLPLLGAATGLHVVDYGIVFVYMLLMIYIGWRCSRVQWVGWRPALNIARFRWLPGSWRPRR